MARGGRRWTTRSAGRPASVEEVDAPALGPGARPGRVLGRRGRRGTPRPRSPGPAIRPRRVRPGSRSTPRRPIIIPWVRIVRRPILATGRAREVEIQTIPEGRSYRGASTIRAWALPRQGCHTTGGCVIGSQIPPKLSTSQPEQTRLRPRVMLHEVGRVRGMTSTRDVLVAVHRNDADARAWFLKIVDPCEHRRSYDSLPGLVIRPNDRTWSCCAP
jgi:hypothetical protein